MKMSDKVDLVLLQSVKSLGNKGDIVSVAIPYAKNVLIAQWKAKPADKQAISEMAQKKDKLKKEEKEATDTFDAIAKWNASAESLKIQKKSTPQWHLYEKVSLKEIQEAIYSAAGIKVDTSWILMSQKIDSIGETSVSVQYKGKKTTIKLTIS